MLCSLGTSRIIVQYRSAWIQVTVDICYDQKLGVGSSGTMSALFLSFQNFSPAGIVGPISSVLTGTVSESLLLLQTLQCVTRPLCFLHESLVCFLLYVSDITSPEMSSPACGSLYTFSKVLFLRNRADFIISTEIPSLLLATEK